MRAAGMQQLWSCHRLCTHVSWTFWCAGRLRMVRRSRSLTLPARDPACLTHVAYHWPAPFCITSAPSPALAYAIQSAPAHGGVREQNLRVRAHGLGPALRALLQQQVAPAAQRRVVAMVARLATGMAGGGGVTLGRRRAHRARVRRPVHQLRMRQHKIQLRPAIKPYSFGRQCAHRTQARGPFSRCRYS